MRVRTNQLLIIMLITTIVLIGVFSITLSNQYAYAKGDVYYTDGVLTRDVITDSFNYAYYTESTGSVGDSCPEYYNTNSSLTNTCAPVAGAEIVAFYDRNYTSLISGYTPGVMTGGKYKYFPMTYNTSYPQGVINTLFTSMGTNTIEPGTSEAQFQTGLTNYVTNAGYSISYTSIKSGSTINYSSMVSYTSSGTPIALFFSDYNYCAASIGSTSATYTITRLSGKHMMVLQQYRQITYYNSSNNVIRTDLLLRVSTGFQSPKVEWLLLGASGTTLDDALTVSIY